MKTKKTYPLLVILFITTSLFSFQNKNSEVPFDSISKKMEYYAENEDYENALIYSRKMLKKAFKNKNKKQKADSFFKIAEFHRKLNSKDSAFYYYNKSKQLYFLTKDSIQIAKSLFQLAIIQSDYGSFTTSDSTAVQSLKYFNGKHIEYIASLYNCMGINSKQQFLYEDAIFYYETAIKMTKNNSNKYVYNNNIGVLHQKLKNYTKATLIFENLLKKTISNQIIKAKILDNLAYTKMLNNSEDDVLKDFLLAESMRIQENDSYGLIASYSHLSEYYKEKNKPKAIFYAHKMYEMAKKAKAVTGVLEAIDVILALETPLKSIKYLKENITLRDSLQIAETKRQNKFAKIRYNYEEEEAQKLKFKTLAAENNLIAEQAKSKTKSIIIFGNILVFSLLFLVYRRKQQHKKRILKENYNTELRIAKKLHDELGNNIYNVITKVLNPKFETEEVVQDLDKIYLQIRSISHENDSVETGENFENHFKDLVASYNSDSCKIMLKDLCSIELGKLNNEKQIVIYRVFNELFVNMKKHSNANLVVLSCKKTKNLLEMKYTDNGVGFKENNIIFKNGIKNMETRIKTINGNINFESKPNKGLQVTIHFKK